MTDRKIEYFVPQDSVVRQTLLNDISEWLNILGIIPPLSFERLISLSIDYLNSRPESDSRYLGYIMILINNHLWMSWLSGVPVNERLLLLPKCLASAENCKGTFDEFGLICNKCGQCHIVDIEKKAQELGYVTLIAEGSPVVAELIKSGQVSGIIGISCLEALEKAFKHITDAAIPAVAVPLLNDGCSNTKADLDMLNEVLALNYQPQYSQQNYQQLKEFVQGWFEFDRLSDQLSQYGFDNNNQVAKVALDYLAADGKRNRPFCTTAIYQAISNDNTEDFPSAVQLTAIAIELFHKASLIHDDIEDNDTERYGQPTLNASYGNAYAINAGDYLIGSGYKLLSYLPVELDIKCRIIQAISSAHQELTVGQGLELANDKEMLTLEQILSIFEGKTSPAFKAAFCCGAYLANADEKAIQLLEKLSIVMGIAYQIRDDIDDKDRDDNELSIFNCQEWQTENNKDEAAQILFEKHLDQCRMIIENIQPPRLKFLLAKIISRLEN